LIAHKDGPSARPGCGHPGSVLCRSTAITTASG